MKPPHRDILAAFVHQRLAERGGWDELHEFLPLHWDGTSLTIDTIVAIDPGIHAHRYPGLMATFAGEQIAAQSSLTTPTLYGFLLVIEMYSVTEPKDPTPAEAAAFQRDRIERRFHQRPDAVEVANAWCVDVHRRIWLATKRRDKPEQIEQHFWPDSSADRAPGGQMVKGLRAAAATAGVALYGLPPLRPSPN